MRVSEAKTEAELGKVIEVLLQLRTDFTAAALGAQIRAQQRDGYRIAYVESAGAVLCVAGFVVATKLAWGRHIYVDDLVTAAHRRSEGAGAFMLDWLRQQARELGCRELHLDSGVQRFAAHRFYLRHGFEISSHHFSLSEL